MTGYDVRISALLKSGAAASAAGEQAGAVDLSAAIGGVSDALRGSRSAPVARQAGERLNAAIRGWSAKAGAQGANMTASAWEYERNEEAATRDLPLLLPGLTRPF